MITMTIACSQCGRDAPSNEAELATWRHGALVLEDDEVGEGLLLCPDCDAEHRERAFEEGEGG